ncbi:MAG TPA: gluconokinase [Burkholderiales bacterium]|nr:gluconokinase [Burkholderiales bacterium]
MIIVVMGVTGAGKTTVGAELAERLGWRFIEADDFHTESAWQKMERGEALTDADRTPWLARLNQELARVVTNGESAILACSALKAAYRDALTPPGLARGEMRFVYLRADRDVTARRLAGRRAHRASPHLLDSQIATLEEPGDALTLPNTLPPEEIVRRIVEAWALA